MDIAQILREDYQKFPADQTYSIYTQDVFFKDPLTQFRGLERYKKMIGFIRHWFIDPHLELHALQQVGHTIETRWTLSWNAPLPWRPRIAIRGWSCLELNDRQQIMSHIDYWNCSRLDVLKQLLPHWLSHWLSHKDSSAGERR